MNINTFAKILPKLYFVDLFLGIYPHTNSVCQKIVYNLKISGNTAYVHTNAMKINN